MRDDACRGLWHETAALNQHPYQKRSRSRGRPLIEYGLLFLRSQGITEVVINLYRLGRENPPRL